ncbi:glycerol-3-phosphate dehydrogenase/oxidase [Croceitalea vernalis]|uniref:Glycerol-3-phosphate dehydrogenase n=1 Tax=Croceitalea vernalis TaxID=3075599 RepID=A0ABU3BJK7_9FLAO|nr:glycerol-3-phosphate dehydrogenase/oxidase [Croceitalea sp. P007]MDT0622314.1 glycerol-3-phosphate dehydrogenase/oxidase [Croceitalea sp. P007]
MDKMMGFSILNRTAQIAKLQKIKFDLAIIGGGVTGAGIALDAASRGLKVCLVEKNDFASGTSNKSTKLIHGGLRYLKQFEIGLVRESGSERAIVHKLAPHLVIPEKMLLPLVKGGTYGKMMTAIGLQVYDFLADVKGDDRRKMLDKKETLSKEPLLNKDEVLGGGLYAEYRTDDARLTIEILKKAASYGATIVNYCEMESFNYDDNHKVKSLNCKDDNTGNTLKIKARNYVSAAGPWVDTLRAKDQSMNKKHLHLTKGVHIVFPYEKLPVKQPLYFDVPDGRMIFAIPRGRATYVGTTDTNYSGSLNRVVATIDDANYIIAAVNNTFPELNLTVDDIESNWAGLRPLIHEEDKDPSELSRKDELFISDSGLISIAGGKLTGYRKMADRVIEAVLKTMKKKHISELKKSETAEIPLVSPSLENSKNVKKYQKELEAKLYEMGITNTYHAWYLCTTYGKQSEIILEKSKTFENNDVLERLIRAELWFSIHYEMTNSLSDFFVRRTGRLYFNIASVSKYIKITLNDFVTYFNWGENRISDEVKIINSLVQDATVFYNEEFK